MVLLRRSHLYAALLSLTVMVIIGCAPAPVPEQEQSLGAVERMTGRADVDLAVATEGLVSEVTVTPRDGGDPTVFSDLVQLYTQHYRAMTYAGGSLFALHRSGAGEGPVDSLWRHEATGTGVRLAQGQGLDARVSYDGRYVATTSQEEVLLLRDGEVMSMKPRATMVPTAEHSIRPSAAGSAVAWFEVFQAAEVLEQVRLDGRSGAIERFDLTGFPIGSQSDTDQHTGRMVYWDMPVAFDVETATAQANRPSSLRLLDPSRGTEDILVDLPRGIRITELYWQDRGTVIYRDTSSGERRIVPVN